MGQYDGTEIHISSSVVTVVGALITSTLGAGTVTANSRTEVVPTFFARLSDNPSIPDHEKGYSKGRGRLDMRGGTEHGATILHYELDVQNVAHAASAVHIRGEKSAAGEILVTLYKGEPLHTGSVWGTIRNDEVTWMDVPALMWGGLAEGNGVITVHTGFAPGGEIVGVVRPRPLRGWIILN